MKSIVVACMAALFVYGTAHAATEELRYSGKLLLTGGVSALEGASGGGLATWATIGGYGAADGFGGDIHGTLVHTSDYTLGSAGGAVGLYDRVEFS